MTTKHPTRPVPRRIARRALQLVVALALVLIAVPIGFRLAASRRESQAAEALAPAQGRFVSAGGLSIFIEELGPETGRPIVMIHGAMAWSGTFRPLMERLAGAGYRAIAIDVPPFGFSSRPTTADYGRAPQARRIGALLDALALHDVVLLGHSFGAGATVETAMTRPDRVTALVLLAGALGIDEIAASTGPPALPFPLAFAPLRDALVATIATNPFTTGAVLRSMMANDTVATDERIAVYQAPFAVTGLTPAVGDWISHGLFADERSSVSARAPAYRAYSAPVLLVWGRRDSVTPLAQGEALRALVPHADLVVRDHVGHLPHVEDLDGVSAAILAWLARTSE